MTIKQMTIKQMTKQERAQVEEQAQEQEQKKEQLKHRIEEAHEHLCSLNFLISSADWSVDFDMRLFQEVVTTFNQDIWALLAKEKEASGMPVQFGTQMYR